MRRSRWSLSVAAALALVVGPFARPAAAGVVASTSGTTITVAATGSTAVGFSCSGGSTAVNGIVAMPAVPCASLSKVTVTGDAGAQQLYGAQLDAFAGHPALVASLGDGADTVQESAFADTISTGPGDDLLSLDGGAPNVSMDLGAGTADVVYVRASTASDQVTVASTGASLIAERTTPSTGATATDVVSGAESLSVYGYGGADVLSTEGVSAASTLTSISLYGGDGDDTLAGGPKGEVFATGSGTNTVSAGAGSDVIWSESSTDALDGGSDALVDLVHDTASLHAGGRTLTGFGTQDVLEVQALTGDVTARVRPTAGGAALATITLTRNGQQLLPASFGTVEPIVGDVGQVAHRSLVDVVAAGHRVSAQGEAADTDLLDVTIPSGTWQVTDIGGTVEVLPNDPAYRPVSMIDVDAYRVHGPWASANRGFAHRATRDLLFRFASTAALDDLQAKLDAGTRSRAQVVAGLMGTDEYRGLDVDRTFVKYLGRVPDASGRSYWIGGLRNGKALWRFRAQLFGSNEYFAKAGGTNALYVQRAYADVLGRAPDPSGLAYWSGKLDKGADRGSVALQFINSAEARRRLVDDQFLRFLDRTPTGTEQATWVSALPGATGEQDLIAFLVGSSAYLARS